MSQLSGDARVEPLSTPGQQKPGAGGTTSPPLQPVAGSGAGRSRVQELELPPGFVVEETSVEELLSRVARMERRIRVQLYALIVLALVGLGVMFDDLLVEEVIVQQKLMESRELKLLDNDGNPRLFLRMYSKVPVLQIMDSNGKPRMSLGLRFDDTPFLDLSDRSGRTRATLEMTEDDAPALRLFDENGTPTFNIN